MNGYTDLVVDVSGRYDACHAPEIVRRRARYAWLRAMEKSGLTFIAGEAKAHPVDGGYVIYWFVGHDEYWYYVTLNLAEARVAAEKKMKAQKEEPGENT